MNSFFFYDLETTGLNKAFDQVVQFAAIRTDPAFQEIERREITVRLRPDIVPSPGAVLTHGLSSNQLSRGLAELDATVNIHRWMNQPGTISLGYNTLGFDDEFLRFAFYRNLLPPYTHQYQNGCRRMDLLPMAVIFHLYHPEGIDWPVVDGRPSLKLEHLAEANDLGPGQAHDAMADVEATVSLARRFLKSGPTWRYLAEAFDKAEDTRRMEKLPEGLPGESAPHRLGILAASEFGADNNYQVPALLLGNSIPYGNQTLWLRLDDDTLQKTEPETALETPWVIRKKTGEPPMVLPPRERFWRRLGATRDRRVRANLGWLKSEPDLLARITDVHRRFCYPEIPDLDPDAALYQDGFFSRREETWCRQFHSVLPGERSALVDQAPSQRLRHMAVRILLRNDPDPSRSDMADHWIELMRRVNPESEDEAMVDYRGQRRTTPRGALAEIDRCLAENGLSPKKIEILESLKGYIRSTFGL